MSENPAAMEHGEKMYQTGIRQGTDRGWDACTNLARGRWQAAREAKLDPAVIEALYGVYLAMTDAAPWNNPQS